MRFLPDNALTTIAAAGLVLALAGPALAGINAMGDVQEFSIPAAKETHQPVRLKPGKPDVMKMDADVGSVDVDGGGQKLVAFVQSSRAIALFPKAPGAAHVVVHGKNGEVIMARYVFTIDPANKYVRLKQTCGKEPCTRLYFCPNLCYQTHAMEPPPAVKE